MVLVFLTGAVERKQQKDAELVQ
jgi:hypothetical protein